MRVAQSKLIVLRVQGRCCTLAAALQLGTLAPQGLRPFQLRGDDRAVLLGALGKEGVVAPLGLLTIEPQ
eukprot:7710135-Pyramimonas_sp.AAC.1